MSSNAVGCILWWKMDDNLASTAVVDSSGESADGVFTDATGNPHTSTHTTDGKINAALTFDGTDDHILASLLSQITKAGKFTIVMLIKSTSIGASNILQNTQVGANNRVGLYINANEIRFGYYDGVRWTSKNGSVTQDKWALLIAKNDGGTVSLRINNVEQTATANDAYAGTHPDYLYIGKDSTVENHFTGSMDALTIFDRVLTIDEEIAVWNGGSGLATLEELDDVEQFTRTLRRR